MRPHWLIPVLALTLTACSAEPRDELRGDVEALTLAANDGDAIAVRTEAQELLATIRRQRTAGDLDPAEADRLRTLVERIAKNADALEPTPTPVPTAEEPTSEPEPEPTEEEPEPSPTEEEPEPTEEPEPEPTEQEPEPPEETVEVVVPPVEDSPSAAANSQSGSGQQTAEPEPTASA